MADPLASLNDLRARLEFEIDAGDHLEKLAEASLEDASTLVREYGVRTWTAGTAPPIAVMLTLKAAARFMNNPMSLEQARGADEQNSWGSGNANGVHLLPDEIALLREHRKQDRGVVSVPTQLWGAAKPRVINGHQVPVDYGNGTAKWFPLYEEGDQYDPYYPSED